MSAEGLFADSDGELGDSLLAWTSLLAVELFCSVGTGEWKFRMNRRDVGDLCCADLPVARSIRNINESVLYMQLQSRLLKGKTEVGERSVVVRLKMFQPPNFLEAEEIARSTSKVTVILPPPTATNFNPLRFQSMTRRATLSFQGNKKSTTTKRTNANFLGPMGALLYYSNHSYSLP